MSSGFRFRKRFKILPWFYINVSKTGFSVSLGPSDAHITTGVHGIWFYLDLPGSGAYYRKKLDAKNDNDKDDQQERDENSNLDVGFFQRLTTPPSELALVNALRALAEDDYERTYEHARQATHLADGAFLAGCLALRQEQFEDAREYLKKAWEKQDELGQHFTKYEVDIAVGLPLTEEVNAHLRPNPRDVLLALSLAYEYLDMPELAIESLLALHKQDPEDLIVRLSLAEVLSERYPNAEQVHRQIVELAEDVHNESPIHAALMYYRARALRKLGVLEGARDTLTRALRRKKDYPEDLLYALRYERAMIYDATGKEKKARSEFEKIYAQSPSYEDVAAKLGL